MMMACQIEAATGKGSTASGRNRIASNGGLTYGPTPSVVDGMYSGWPSLSRVPAS